MLRVRTFFSHLVRSLGNRLEKWFWASRLSHWRQAILIVKPETLLRRHREGFKLFWRWKTRARTMRPRLPQSTIDLIRRMAIDNRLWGTERIRGELPKVGIYVAKRSIQKYLRRLRPKSAPSQTWATHVKTHAADTFPATSCRSWTYSSGTCICISSSSWERVGSCMSV